MRPLVYLPPIFFFKECEINSHVYLRREKWAGSTSYPEAGFKWILLLNGLASWVRVGFPPE